MTGTAASIATLIDTFVTDIELNFVYWSEDATFAVVVQDILGETVMDAAVRMLEKIQTDYGYYERVVVANPEGKVVAASSRDDLQIQGRPKPRKRSSGLHHRIAPQDERRDCGRDPGDRGSGILQPPVHRPRPGRRRRPRWCPKFPGLPGSSPKA